MEILKFNVFNFLNKSKKTTVPLVLLCPTFPYLTCRNKMEIDDALQKVKLFSITNKLSLNQITSVKHGLKGQQADYQVRENMEQG